MPMRALVVLAAAMAAVPALSAADTAKRDPDRPVASWFVATPSGAGVSSENGKEGQAAKKPKRVRYTIPAPTRM